MTKEKKIVVYAIMEYGVEHGKLHGVYLNKERAKEIQKRFQEKQPSIPFIGPYFKIEIRELCG
jgi:hypothetical protein